MPLDTPSTGTVADVLPDIVSDSKEVPGKDGIDLDQYPEGGTAAWCTVIGGALVQFCGFGYTSSFGVYQSFYTLGYLTNESNSVISWIGSTNAFTMCTVGLVSGMLYDRGYCYHLLILGSLLQSFFLLMLSLAKPGQFYQIFLTQAIGLGFAQGLAYIPAIAVASQYFHRRRTLAMSLIAAGSSLGSVVHPIMLNYLFNRYVGFANGVRISAAFNSVLLFVACLLIRTRFKPVEHRVDYLAVGRGVIHDLPFCLMSVGFLIFQIAFYYPIFYMQLDSILHGNSETFSFYSLTILNGGSLIGRLSTGFIAPRVGIPWLMIIATASCGILILGMIGLHNIPTVAILGLIYGYFAGVYVALLTPLTALLTHDLSEFGARMGIMSLVTGIGSLIDGPISGALLTSQYKWWQSSLFNGLAGLTGSFVLLLMELARRRRDSTKKQELAA